MAAGGRSCAARRNGRTRWPRARMNRPARSDRPKAPRASSSRRCSARSTMTGFPILMSTSRSTATVRLATVTVRGPSQPVPASIEAAHALGDKFWPLTVARELEDAILHLRVNEADHRCRAAAHRRQRAGRARARRFPRQGRWRLADARNPPLPQTGAQAHRRDCQDVLCRSSSRAHALPERWPSLPLPPTAR